MWLGGPVVEVLKVEDICDEYEKMQNIKTPCYLVLHVHIGKRSTKKHTIL